MVEIASQRYNVTIYGSRDVIGHVTIRCEWFSIGGPMTTNPLFRVVIDILCVNC